MPKKSSLVLNTCRTDAPSTFRITFAHTGKRGVFTVLECWQPTREEARLCTWAEFDRRKPGVRARISEVRELTRPEAGATLAPKEGPS